MKAAVLEAVKCTPQYRDFADPTPAEGEVLVEVTASAIKPVDRQLAAGTHFASPREFPVVCGSDGVGRLGDGSRVFFGGPRPPYGAMATRTVVRRAQCFPMPAELDDATAAAIANPGVSAWLSLQHRARVASGETVLILGATGVTGKLAIQIAKLLGAGRVVAAGRNPEALSKLPELGADATIPLEADAFRRESQVKSFDVVLDYLWGAPTEALLAALTREGFAIAGSETRLLQVGESAGATISLPAAVLRSAPVTILGTAGIPPFDVLTAALEKVFDHAAHGQLRIDIDRMPLAEVATAWERPDRGRRCVLTMG